MDKIEVQENNINEKEFSIVEFYKKHNFLLNCVVLSCLFLANCFLSYFTYIAHIFVLLLVIISETKVAVGYLVFSFPFNSIYLPYSAICFGVCVFAMMVKLCIIKYKEDKNSFKVSKTTIILLIVFVVYLMLPIKREFDFAYILRMLYLTLGSVLVYIFVKFNKEFDWRKNLKILLISTLLSCCFAFFHYVSPLLKITHKDWWGDNGFLGFGALMFNPNTLALICLAAITIFTYYAITSKLTVTETLTVGAFLLVGIVTRSRAFFVISLFNLIALFISGFKQKNANILYLFLGLFWAVVLLFVFGFEKIKMFLDEFSIKTKDFESLTSAINAFSSSRIEIWSVYLKDWISNPIFIIFGRGISSPILIEVKVLNSIRKLSPHNMFLTMFYQLGVVGAILYITFIVFVIKDAFKGQSKANKAILIPLISFLMLAMVEDLFFYMF